MEIYDQWSQYDSERERELRKMPVCEYCREHICQERAVKTNEGFICDQCLDDMRMDLDDHEPFNPFEE